MILFFNSSISSSSCVTLWSLESHFFHFALAFDFFTFPRDCYVHFFVVYFWIKDSSDIWSELTNTLVRVVRSKKESIETIIKTILGVKMGYIHLISTHPLMRIQYMFLRSTTLKNSSVKNVKPLRNNNWGILVWLFRYPWRIQAWLYITSPGKL